MKPGAMVYGVEKEDGERYCLKLEEVRYGKEYEGKYWYFGTMNAFPYWPDSYYSYIEEDQVSKVLLLAPPELTTWSK